MSTTPRRALVVIDVQNEYFDGGLPIAYPPVSQSLPNILRAMGAAREHGIPVVVVQHETPPGAPVFARGSHGWELHPEIAAQPADHRIDKTMASVFAGTGLREWLAARGIDTLVIAGYMTQNCDAATAYAAAHDGLKVEFLSDASGVPAYENAAGKASAEEIHRVFSVVFHSNFAAVSTTEAWIGAVEDGVALEADNVYLSAQRALRG